MADVHDTRPRRSDARGRPRLDLLVCCLDVAASALRKARRHAQGDDVARLTSEAQDRVARAVALARESARARQPTRRRSA